VGLDAGPLQTEIGLDNNTLESTARTAPRLKAVVILKCILKITYPAASSNNVLGAYCSQNQYKGNQNATRQMGMSQVPEQGV